ncbi:MAG: hypothetical protein V3W44_04955 [Dehalococcoidales bacterium]
MKALKTTTNGNTFFATAMTVTLVALLLLGITFASGYVVGAVRHAPKRPTEFTLPAPSRWCFMAETPHASNGCKSLRTDI